MKKSEKGFSIIEILLVVVVIGIVGAVGWLVYDRQNSGVADKSNTSADIQKVEETPEKKTDATKDPYVDWEAANFELVEANFKYPKELNITHELAADAGPNTSIETYTLTASDNTKIILEAFHFQGGFSGDEPKYLIEDVTTGTDTTNSREFTSIIYKNNDGDYDAAYVMDSTQTEYKTGQETQIFINSFGVRPKGVNTVNTQFSISFSGEKTYNTLAEIKSMGVYKDIEKFLNALDIPSNE